MQGFLQQHRKGASASASALLLVLTMASTAPLVGCSSGEREIPPPVDDTRGGMVDYGNGSGGGYGYEQQQAPAAREGMSTKKKLVILAGAAALYYLYKKHQNAQAQHGPESQYYLSKNGRIYYRDEQGRAHWVTPPQGGIQVPEHEAQAYRDLQGFGNRHDGMTMQDVYQMEMGASGGGGYER